MPPQRDEQDFEQRRQQILNGALEVFATKGFEKATNKDIAEAAGIGSPGLIYHYFKDKTDLLHEVIQQRVPLLALFAQPDEFMALPPRAALTLFARAFLKALENRMAVNAFKLVIGEALRRPGLATMVSEIGPQRGFALLSTYLNKQMDAGVLRRVDVSAATRCFIGPLIAFFIAQEVFPQIDAHQLSAETMATTHVDVFLQGLQAEPERPA